MMMRRYNEAALAVCCCCLSSCWRDAANWQQTVGNHFIGGSPALVSRKEHNEIWSVAGLRAGRRDRGNRQQCEARRPYCAVAVVWQRGRRARQLWASSLGARAPEVALSPWPRRRGPRIFIELR